MRSNGAASCIVPSKIMPPLSVRARLGESVSIDGLPQSSILASTGDSTIGTMTAVAGSGAAMREIRISAPVHQGSSGAAPVTVRTANALDGAARREGPRRHGPDRVRVSRPRCAHG